MDRRKPGKKSEACASRRAPEDGAEASAAAAQAWEGRGGGQPQLLGQGVAAQPLPKCWQHQAFLSSDHPACQFAKPASQSKGGAAVPQPPAAGGQPLPVLWQHHAFFATDHSTIQLA